MKNLGPFPSTFLSLLIFDLLPSVLRLPRSHLYSAPSIYLVDYGLPPDFNRARRSISSLFLFPSSRFNHRPVFSVPPPFMFFLIETYPMFPLPFVDSDTFFLLLGNPVKTQDCVTHLSKLLLANEWHAVPRRFHAHFCGSGHLIFVNLDRVGTWNPAPGGEFLPLPSGHNLPRPAPFFCIPVSSR